MHRGISWNGCWVIMINADTAIVGNGAFVHYCHKAKGLMYLRTHHPCCPLCLQKNPDYISNKLVFPVTKIETGSIVLIFADQNKAIQYIQDHYSDNLALGDTGYVE